MDQTIAHATALSGRIALPPDKSIAHRTALLSAIASGPSRIHNYSTAADPQSTLDCVRALGIRVEETNDGLVVHGRGLHGLTPPDAPLDCGNSGTTMRLLAGILAGQQFGSQLTGDASLRARPMTVYDLLHTGYNYDVYGTPADIPIVGSFIDASGSISAERVAAEVALAQARFNLEQSYRIGAGYQLDRLGPFSDIAFGADYIGYGSPQVDQTFLAHLHLGARAHLTRFLALRTGISQGYPSVGAGLHLGVFHVNYALHAVEQGRTPGQVSSYIHALRFAFEL